MREGLFSVCENQKVLYFPPLVPLTGRKAIEADNHGGISVATQHDQELLRRRQQQDELRLLCHAGLACLHGGEAERKNDELVVKDSAIAS